MANHKSKMPSQRQLRVGEQIKHILAQSMQRGNFYHDDIDAARITITEVRPSPDLRNATAFIIVADGDTAAAVDALNAQRSIFQKEIASQSTTKFTPKVVFKEDYAFAQAGRIEDLLNDITYSDQE